MLLHQLQPGAPALVPQALNLSLQFMDAGHQFLVGSLLSAICRDCGVAQIKIEGHTRKSPQHVKKFPPVKLPNLRRHRSLTVTDLSNSSTLLSIWFSLSPWHSTSSSWQNSDASSCPIQSNQLQSEGRPCCCGALFQAGCSAQTSTSSNIPSSPRAQLTHPGPPPLGHFLSKFISP